MRKIITGSTQRRIWLRDRIEPTLKGVSGCKKIPDEKGLLLYGVKYVLGTSNHLLVRYSILMVR